MAINTKIQSQIAFKRLAGNVVLTNPDASAYEEVIGSSVQLSTDVIFGEQLPSSPGLSTLFDTASNSAGVGVVQLVKFDLVAIDSSQYDADSTGFGSTTANQFDTADSGQAPGKHAFALHFTSNYENENGSNSAGVSQNPKAGTGFFQNSLALTGSLGQVQIVPPRYGSEYIPIIRNSSDVPIDIGGADQDFYLDTFAGVLFRQDVDDSEDLKPTTLEAYVYIGKMASETSVDVGAEGLSPTLAAGNTAENDIILTGSLIVTASAGATDTIDFSGVNSVTASAFNVTGNTDIDGNLNVDGNAVVDGTLTVGGNVTLGDNTSDTVTVAGDLVVQGSTTTINTTNVVVEDQFLLLNSSSGAILDVSAGDGRDGGIIVARNQNELGAANSLAGTALFYDHSRQAWGITGASGSLEANLIASNATSGDNSTQVNVVTIEINNTGAPLSAGQPNSNQDRPRPHIGKTETFALGQMYVDSTDTTNGGLYIYLPE